MTVNTSEHISDIFCRKIKDKGLISLGFDPVFEKMPQFLKNDSNIYNVLTSFFKLMLEALHDKIPLIKFQSADFEVYGIEGLKALTYCLKETKKAGLLTLLDVKRGDIGRSSESYAKAYLSPKRQIANIVQDNEFEADAITISPYMGSDSLEPFIQKAKLYNKLLFILLKTSNPGASLVQDICDKKGSVSEQLANWINNQCINDLSKSGLSRIGVVVGATQDNAVHFRTLLPHCLFLMPGLGAQGGSIATVKKCLTNKNLGVIAPISRSLLYPDKEAKNKFEYIENIYNNFNLFSHL